MKLLKFLYYPLFFLSIGLFSVSTSAESGYNFTPNPTSQISLTEISSSSKVNLFYSTFIASHFVKVNEIKTFSEKAVIPKLIELNKASSEENIWLGLLYLEDKGELAIHSNGAMLSRKNQNFFKNPNLVDAWEVLFKEGDEISAALRGNIENLEKLDAFIKAEGADISKLKSSFANAKDPQKWIDMKFPQDELDAAYDAIKNSPLDELIPWTKDHKAQRWANHKSGNPDADFNTWSNKYDGNIKKADAANSGVDDYFNTLGWNCTTCKEVTTKDISILTDDGLKTFSRRHDIADLKAKKAIEVKEYSSGKVYYSEKRIKTQVALDAELLDSKEFLSIEWVFKRCEPSKPLEDALKAAGVTIKRIP